MVEVVPGGNARAAYYDRNAAMQLEYASTLAGASASATTVRWTYTCPAGKQARIEFIMAAVRNLSTTAVNNTAFSEIALAESGGAYVNVLTAWLLTGDASLDRTLTVPGAAVLSAGDSVRYRNNSDNDAAGSNVTLEGSAVLTESDA